MCGKGHYSNLIGEMKNTQDDLSTGINSAQAIVKRDKQGGFQSSGKVVSCTASIDAAKLEDALGWQD